MAMTEDEARLLLKLQVGEFLYRMEHQYPELWARVLKWVEERAEARLQP